jgi:hypothetical protein
LLVKNTISLVILLAAVIGLFGCGKRGEKEEPVTVVEETVKSPSDSTVADEIWYFLNGDVQKNLKLAHDTFSAEDYDSMIHGIRKAAAIMKLEAVRASGQDKIDLDNSIAEMEKLASDVRKKVFVPIPEYEQAFGNAQVVLGKFHLDKAQEMWKKENYFYTGQELNEATLNLENAYLWIDHELDRDSKTEFDRAKKVAADLINDAGWAPADVENAFQSLSKAMVKLQEDAISK